MMSKIGKIAVGVAVGGFVINEVWIGISAKTAEKAMECLTVAENIQKRDLVKKAMNRNLTYKDLTEGEWQELRELLSKMLKEYKKAYRLISITKTKRDEEAIKQTAEIRAKIRDIIDRVKSKIKEMDEFLKANKQQ